MATITRSRDFPALLVALAALVAALGGTALADRATTSAKPLTKGKVKRIAAKQTRKLAPTLSVASAQEAQNAENAQNAVNARSAVNADTAQNADRLDAIDSTGFERSDAVVAGLGIPQQVSREMLRVPSLELRVLTDGEPDADAAVVAQNSSGNLMEIMVGPAPSDLVTVAPNGTTTLHPGLSDWADKDHVVEVLVFTPGRSGVLTCYFPQGEDLPDYCQVTRGQG